MFARFQPDGDVGDFPIDADDIKEHLRLSGSDEDDYLARLAKAGCESVERHTGRSLAERDLVMWLDGISPGRSGEWWSGVRDGSLADLNTGCRSIIIPKCPVTAVGDVTSYDLDNASTVFDPTNYLVDFNDVDKWARINLNEGSLWPVNLRRTNAISIEITVGYGAGGDVAIPEGLKQVTLDVIAHAYANRGDCEGGCQSCMGTLNQWTMRSRL